jgi:integrase
MVQLERTQAGGYKARKGIPADVRDEYQRLYGQRREALFSCPPGTPKPQAKADFGEWVAEVENRIDSIRKRARGEGISLTRKEALGLAGEWYRWFVAKHQRNAENDKAAELGWWSIRGAFFDELEQLAPLWFRQKEGRTEQDWRWIDDTAVRPKVRAIIADYAHTAQFLADRRLVLTAEARDLFLDCVQDEFVEATARLEQLGAGDHSPDERLQRFPPFKLKRVETASPGSSMTAGALFEAWVRAKPRVRSTVNRYRCVFLDLDRKFPSGVQEISVEEAQEWATSLVSPKLSAATVNNNRIRPASAVFKWGLRAKLVRANPFSEVSVDVPHKPREREGRWFKPAEQRIILRAAASETNLASNLGGARRWVPWLMAYSGARCQEITQLRKQDIIVEDGITALRLSPEAGTMKTKQGRLVPLHEHIIEQGFRQFVKSRRDGPLFCNPGRGDEEGEDPTNPKRSPAAILVNRLAEWVRKLGVTDKEISPNHAWRHTFRLRAARYGMSEHVIEAICGWAPANEGRGYGKPTLEDKAEELKKFRRYEF